MTHSTTHLSPALALPAAPQTGDLLALARARLDALEGQLLPALRERRECLTRIWYSDGPDAVRIHLSDDAAVPCAQAGADRLASAVAEEAALVHEASALRELVTALESYEAGGTALLAELDDSAVGPADIGAARLVPRPTGFRDTQSAEARTHARGLATYLSSLRHELREALREGDRKGIAILAAEHGALRIRLRQHMRQLGWRAAGASRRMPVTDRSVRRRSARTA